MTKLLRSDVLLLLCNFSEMINCQAPFFGKSDERIVYRLFDPRRKFLFQTCHEILQRQFTRNYSIKDLLGFARKGIVFLPEITDIVPEHFF